MRARWSRRPAQASKHWRRFSLKRRLRTEGESGGARCPPRSGSTARSDESKRCAT
jgi:hypothetical protein